MDAIHHRTPFEQLPQTGGSLPGSLASIGVHSGLVLFLVFGLRHTPRLGPASDRKHDSVRLMNLRDPLPEEYRVVKAGSSAAASTANSRASTQHVIAAKAPLPVLFAPKIRGTQTLLQPDAPPDAILPRATPIPFVMVWSAQATEIQPTVSTSPVQFLVANEHPSQSAPNHEITAAQLKLAATPIHTAAVTPVPSTTSPVIVPKPPVTPSAPLTVSNAIGRPIPARILSLSDPGLKNETVAIPLANSVATASPSESTSLLQTKSSQNTLDSNKGAITAAKPQAGSGTAPGETGKGNSQTRPGATGDVTNIPQVSGPAGQVPAIVTGVEERNIIRIHRPKDGQFGVVVVGSATAEEYPEAKELWGGRLVYTVYLHVGTGKNWILQYSLPRSVDAATPGSSTRPEPPWPYELARPAPSQDDLDSDTLMIHGFVTVDGRLNKTSLVFPAVAPNAKALLDVLGLWLFRPAQQNGQPTNVEVLLIIPAEGA